MKKPKLKFRFKKIDFGRYFFLIMLGLIIHGLTHDSLGTKIKKFLKEKFPKK